MSKKNSASGTAVVTVRGASKTYQTSGGVVRALKDATLDINAGECVVIMGPSGSGKTTLLGLIGGLIDPDKGGSVVVCGNSWADLPDAARATQRRQAVAFVHQSYNLVDFMTVAENVALPLLMNGERPSATSEHVVEALAALGLEDVGDRRPSTLSGGQQQRAAIARAMATGQPVLLADEPTGALDTATGHLIFQAIRDHADKRGLAVVVSHNPMAAAYADRTVRITDGVISMEG